MHIFILTLGLILGGASKQAEKDAINQDFVLFEQSTFSVEDKKDAVRVYFVAKGEYKKIEEIPGLTECQLDVLFEKAKRAL